MLVSLEQPATVKLWSMVRFLGSEREVRCRQFLNAEPSMLVMESEKTTEVRLGASSHMHEGMVVIPSGNVSDVTPEPRKALGPMEVSAGGSVIFVSRGQFLNASRPIVFKPSGRVRFVILVQPANAYSPMLVIVLGIVTEVR